MIALFGAIHDAGERGPHLVVAPASVLDNWLREVRAWRPHDALTTPPRLLFYACFVLIRSARGARAFVSSSTTGRSRRVYRLHISS